MSGIDKYSIFKPMSSNGLKIDYPELLSYPSIKSLTNNELLLVWYFACEASPFYDIEDDHRRMKKSIKAVHEGRGSTNEIESIKKKKLEDLDFTEKMQEAIETMKSFRMGPRIRAKKMAESILKNFEHIINIDPSSFVGENGELDFSKQKAYVDAASTVSKNLPGIIEQIERGYSVTEQDSEQEETLSSDEGSFIDTYHNQSTN